MRAVTFSQTGSARDVLRLTEVPTPEPGDGDVRVKIATSGVNPSDVKRRGRAPHGNAAEFPVVIPHSDGAGTIDRVGADVPSGRLGERVWLWNAQFGRPFGTAAEYCVVPNEQAVRLPDDVDFAAGACLGVPAMTAFHAIAFDGPVRGQTILVQGGAGAVAHYAIQFAKRNGARVIATVSSEEKASHARAAGADVTIDYKREDVAARVRQLTREGVSRVVEVDLSANARTYPALLARRAHVIVYGSGATIELPSLIPNWTRIQFFVVYTLDADERRAAIDAISSALVDRALQHAIARRLPLDAVVEAHELVERGGVIGNVVLEIGA